MNNTHDPTPTAQAAGSERPRTKGSMDRVSTRKRDQGYGWRAVATVAACAMGAACMWMTNGKTGIGWAAFITFLIWATD